MASTDDTPESEELEFEVDLLTEDARQLDPARRSGFEDGAPGMRARVTSLIRHKAKIVLRKALTYRSRVSASPARSSDAVATADRLIDRCRQVLRFVGTEHHESGWPSPK